MTGMDEEMLVDEKQILRRYCKEDTELDAKRIGIDSKFVSEVPVEMNVLDLHKDKELTLKNMIKAARKAIEEDGAEVVIPGCFGMIGMAARMQKELGIPVIEPAGAVMKHIETLVDLNLAQSPLAYPVPPEKEMDF